MKRCPSRRGRGAAHRECRSRKIRNRCCLAVCRLGVSGRAETIGKPCTAGSAGAGAEEKEEQEGNGVIRETR